MLVIGKSICSHFSEVCRYASNSQIHLCQFEGGVSVLLSIDGHILFVSAVSFDEFNRLHEHTARTAAGVIKNTVIRFKHFGNQVDDTFRRVKFSLTLSFGKSKFAQEVFIHTPDNIVFFIFGVNTVYFIKQ